MFALPLLELQPKAEQPKFLADFGNGAAPPRARRRGGFGARFAFAAPQAAKAGPHHEGDEGEDRPQAAPGLAVQNHNAPPVP